MPFRASGVLCILFAAGCSLVQEPQAFLGTRYVLRSIEGVPLPARYAENRSLTTLMTADTLELRDDGTGAWRPTTLEPETSVQSRQNTEVTFTRSGNTISVVMRCPPGALCIRPPHLVGTISDNGIVFTESLVSRAPLVFDRIP